MPGLGLNSHCWSSLQTILVAAIVFPILPESKAPPFLRTIGKSLLKSELSLQQPVPLSGRTSLPGRLNAVRTAPPGLWILTLTSPIHG